MTKEKAVRLRHCLVVGKEPDGSVTLVIRSVLDARWTQELADRVELIALRQFHRLHPTAVISSRGAVWTEGYEVDQ